MVVVWLLGTYIWAWIKFAENVLVLGKNWSGSERTKGPVASSGSGRAARRGSNPIGIQPGVAPGKFPRGVLGCECV